MIDKVLFDTHVILGDHALDLADPNLRKESQNPGEVLRQSIAEIVRKSSNNEHGDEVSQVHIENALRQSMSKMLRKSEVFAERVNQAKSGGPAAIHGSEALLYNE